MRPITNRTLRLCISSAPNYLRNSGSMLRLYISAGQFYSRRTFRCTPKAELNPFIVRSGAFIAGRLGRKILLKLPKSRQKVYKTRGAYTGIGIISFGCMYYLWHVERAPLTGRYRFLVTSEADEHKLARACTANILEQVKQDENASIMHHHSREHQRVVAIVRRLLSRASSVFGDDPRVNINNMNWSCYIVNDGNTNAFVLPDGTIFVHKNMLNLVGKSDEMLACLLGHEISHALMRHAGEKMSMQNVFNCFTAVIVTSIWLLVPDFYFASVINQLEKQLENVLTEAPYSRKLEKEADYVGLMLASAACFNPHAGYKLWSRFRNVVGEGVPDWASTHPSHV